MKNDGELAAVAQEFATRVATGMGDGYAPGTGAVVLFYLVDGAWTRGELIKASNAEDYDRFGKSVALSRSRVFVGAMTESGGSTGVGGDQSNNDVPRSGAVYLY